MANDTANPYDLIPALEPPPGVISNFKNPWTFDGLAIATVAVCLTTTTLAVAMRILTKIFVMRAFRLEDCQFL